MPRNLTPPFFAALEDSRRILIAGMGGGFDGHGRPWPAASSTAKR